MGKPQRQGPAFLCPQRDEKSRLDQTPQRLPVWDRVATIFMEGLVHRFPSAADRFEKVSAEDRRAVHSGSLERPDVLVQRIFGSPLHRVRESPGYEARLRLRVRG